MSDFFAELRRRKIWWVAGVYLGVSWVIFQLVALLEDTFSLPPWLDMVTVTFLAVGLPLAIILAWAQETQAEDGSDRHEETDDGEMMSIVERSELSVAVLPYDNFTNDEDFGYVADGISEDIITSLSYMPGFQVSARNSSFQYRGASHNIPDIGRELQVNFVLEGSIRVQADMLRITSQLIETSTDKHIWADRTDEPLADFGRQQDVVTGNIAANASEALTAHTLKLLASMPEDEVPAIGLLFRALDIPYTDGKNRDRRRALMLKAIEKEPDNPQFRASLNALIAIDYSIGFSNHPERDREEVLKQADILMRLAPADGRVLNATGMAYVSIGKFEEGLLLLRQAMALTPDIWTKTNMAIGLTRAGKVDEAVDLLEELTERGIEGRAGLFVLLCDALVCQGNMDRALEVSDQLIIHQGHDFMTWLGRANILAPLGRLDEAEPCLKRVRQIVPQFTLAAALAGMERNFALDEHTELMSAGLRQLQTSEQTSS